MTLLLKWMSVLEFVVGVSLALFPALVCHLLLGKSDSDSDSEPIVARIAGVALVSFALACWPSGGKSNPPAVRGMLLYNGAMAGYLTFLGLSGHAGILLWPAAALHTVLTILMIRFSR